MNRAARPRGWLPFSSYARCLLQIFDTIPELFGGVYSVDKLQTFHPFTDTMPILLAEYNSCMIDSLCCQVYEIGIVGAQYIAYFSGAL